MTEECRTCHEPIDWAYREPTLEQPRPKSNPIDHGSADDPKGNLIIWREPPVSGLGDQGVLRYRYRRKGEEPDRAKGEHTGISHFATCPDSKAHRRSKPAWNQERDRP